MMTAPDARPRSVVSRITHSLNSFLLFGGAQGAAQLAAFIYNIIIARWLGPAEFSVYAALYSVIGLSSVFINWGLDTWLLHEGGKNPGELNSLTARVVQIKLTFGAAWAVILLLVLPRLRPDIFSLLFVLVCSLDLWMESLNNTALAAMNIGKKIPQIIVSLALSRGGRLLGAAGLIWLKQDFILYFLVIRFAFTLISLAYSSRIIRLDVRQVLAGSPRPTWVKALPYGFSDMLTLVYAQIDTTLLVFLAGETAVGFYTPAVGMINGIISIFGSAFSFYLPRLSRLWLQDQERYRKASRWFIAGLAGLGVMTFFLIQWSADWIVRVLLEDQYAPSAAVLKILSCVILLKSFSFGFAGLLVSSGRQKDRLLPQGASAVLNVILNFMMISKLNVIGSSFAYVASELVLMVGYGLFSARRPGVPARPSMD
jgi:O-antigen/teichoic acid export membrane protein